MGLPGDGPVNADASGGGGGGGGGGIVAAARRDAGSKVPDAFGSNKSGNRAGGQKDVAAAADGEGEEEEEEEEEEVDIDEEQLEEYKEMLDELGSFADKVSINILSMVAEDFKDSPGASLAIYSCVRDLLLSSSVAPDRKLPLVYLIDSILKNVKGRYVGLVEADARLWLSVAHGMVNDEHKAKIRRVWNTWREFRIFAEDRWKDMGRCFFEHDARIAAARKVAEAKARAIGIERMPDGTLKLAPHLRKQMQILLDEAQSEGVDELEKVSLERLGEINPDLLVEIKKAAEEMMQSGSAIGMTDLMQNAIAGAGGSSSPNTSFWIETRPPDVVFLSAEWEKLNLNHLERTHDIIAGLQRCVRDGTTNAQPADDPIAATSLFAAAAAAATHLTSMLVHLRGPAEMDTGAAKSNAPYYMGNGTAVGKSSAAIDRNMFTNDGIRKKVDTVIARLYEAGLPFVSSSDGRRFATQMQLSHHLDELFRKGQIEKTMERTEERGWYINETSWTRRGDEPSPGTDQADAAGNAATGGDGEDQASPEKSTVPADEARDRCVICGINFNMFFDQDEGEWKYSNCREVDVLNDEAAEKEKELMLVHVTCLRGLGSPPHLTVDQVIIQ